MQNYFDIDSPPPSPRQRGINIREYPPLVGGKGVELQDTLLGHINCRHLYLQSIIYF